MAKMKKLRRFKYNSMKLCHSLIAADPKFKKQKKYREKSVLDADGVAEREEQCNAREIKLSSAWKRSLSRGTRSEFDRLEKEHGTDKAALKPAEKLVEGIDKLKENIKPFKL
ncbi:hypothetical protein EI94DRAFT_1703462 [Lactarius quietus]|nr:hypothetical protein EI94DRAFT_1703462 [Lactarius quietus]